MKKTLPFSAKAILLACFLAVTFGVCAQDQHTYRIKHRASEVEMVDGTAFYYGPSGVYNAHNGRLCGVKNISQLALDPNGSTFAIATSSSKKSGIEVYSLWETDRLFAQTSMQVRALCYDATGGSLWAADASGIVHCLNPISLKEKGTLTTNSEILDMVCGSGDLLAVAHKSSVRLHFLKLQIVRTIDTGSAPVSMAFSHDGRYLAIACADNRLRLFDTQRSNETETTLPAQAKACAFSPDGEKLVVAMGTDSVMVVPVSGGASSTVALGMSAIEFVGFATLDKARTCYLVYANHNEIIYKEITSISALR